MLQACEFCGRHTENTVTEALSGQHLEFPVCQRCERKVELVNVLAAVIRIP